MSHQTLKFKITGESPLLMHNGQLVDPLNKWQKLMKPINAKRKKTDADYEDMAKLEWYGSLYLHNGKPCIPGEVLEATFTAAAKKSKRGTDAKMGSFCPDNYPIDYNEPEDTIDTLWEAGNHRMSVPVRLNGRSGVIRTRPRFDEWSAECEIVYDDEVFNERDVIAILETAGRYIGMMDWRPRYGRFSVEVANGK